MNRLSLKGLLCDNAKSVCLGDVLMKRSEARRGSARAPPDASRHDSISMEESYVETKVEALEGNRVKVSVTIDAKQVDSRIKQAYAQAAQEIQLPRIPQGQGPAPGHRQRSRQGLHRARPSATTSSTRPIPSPSTIATSIPSATPSSTRRAWTSWRQRQGLLLLLRGRAVKPEFELSSYEPVEIELPAEGATDEEVDDSDRPACASTTSSSSTRPPRPRSSPRTGSRSPSRRPTTRARTSRPSPPSPACGAWTPRFCPRPSTTS